MATRGSRGAQQRARTDAERARLYAARRDWNDGLVARRRRDTVIAVVAGGLIVIGAGVSQAVHAQVSAPAPKPSPTATEPAPEPLLTPPADESPAPTQTPGE
ncbi:hypothetical protein [uncultured Microbacterium sp.]|jgi:peptidyl-prolyl cis-trans isomerase B (cyclophilin B)|uniref:hypothetical protein n=1 Tax=uncultured Microbacterium sp. TaxID=191216 RepID=UPI00260B09D7|nr:hypothetical protein [uncultured Microbacterium sp.]